MKFRLLDRITNYTPRSGISVVHTVGFEEILLARKMGSMEAPRAFLLALAVEASGFFYAVESNFQYWVQLDELESLSVNLPDHNTCWSLELKQDGQFQMVCSGVLSGTIKLKTIELATLYEPEERKAMFKVLQRGS